MLNMHAKIPYIYFPTNLCCYGNNY